MRCREARSVGDERGAVTVEAAIALCALIVVFALVLGGLAAVTDQIRCTDAAREAARLLARGDRPLAEQAVRAIAPSGARLVVGGDGEALSVQIVAKPAGGFLPGIELRGEAYAVAEPGADPSQRTGVDNATP